MRFILLATAIAAIASPALAGDFTGPRAEVRLGYDRITASVTDASGRTKGHDDGLLYGAGIGYDFSAGGSLIVGVEANLDFATTKSCDPVLGNDEFCIKAGRDLDAAVRFGTISNGTLIYVKAGYANSRLRTTYSDFVNASNNFNVSGDKDGYRLGAGLEFKLSPKAYAKVEYNYTGYGSDSASGTTIEFDRNQVIGAIGVRF